jgi:hypothetical protein
MFLWLCYLRCTFHFVLHCVGRKASEFSASARTTRLLDCVDAPVKALDEARCRLYEDDKSASLQPKSPVSQLVHVRMVTGRICKISLPSPAIGAPACTSRSRLFVLSDRRREWCLERRGKTCTVLGVGVYTMVARVMRNTCKLSVSRTFLACIVA